MRILISGDRDWDDPYIINCILNGYASDLDPVTVISGMAPGADTIAAEWAKLNEEKLDPYPADWKKFHRAAGPIRNQQMLDKGKPDIVIAFHDDLDGKSKGTKDMVERAVKAGVPVYHVRRVTK